MTHTRGTLLIRKCVRDIFRKKNYLRIFDGFLQDILGVKYPSNTHTNKYSEFGMVQSVLLRTCLKSLNLSTLEIPLSKYLLKEVNLICRRVPGVLGMNCKSIFTIVFYHKYWYSSVIIL